MPPTFSLLGPTPSAATAGQLPWASYYTGQNNVNEQNRRDAILTTMRAQEAQDRADENARQFDETAAINFATLNRAYDERRRQEAENLRRYNIGLGTDREKEAEEKRRFNITSLINRERIPKYEAPETPAERLTAQIDMLNAATGSVRLKQLAAALEDAKRTRGPHATLTPAEERDATFLNGATAKLIAQSLSGKIGAPDPSIRWDDSSGQWTTTPETRKSFIPVMGDFRSGDDEVATAAQVAKRFHRPLAPGARYDIPGQAFTIQSPSIPRTAVAPATPPATSTATVQPPLPPPTPAPIPRPRRHSAAYYDRVSQLIDSGVPPREAMNAAGLEFP